MPQPLSPQRSSSVLCEILAPVDALAHRRSPVADIVSRLDAAPALRQLRLGSVAYRGRPSRGRAYLRTTGQGHIDAAVTERLSNW